MMLGDIIGRGSFAVVRKATWQRTEVAVKARSQPTPGAGPTPPPRPTPTPPAAHLGLARGRRRQLLAAACPGERPFGQPADVVQPRG